MRKMKKPVKKKKKRWSTKREYVRLIKDIAEATRSDSKHAQNLAALLSAMRGPDNGDNKLKAQTTTVIRNRLKWKCGSMLDSRKPLSHIGTALADEIERTIPATSVGKHFRRHIEEAVQALKHFGFTEVR